MSKHPKKDKVPDKSGRVQFTLCIDKQVHDAILEEAKKDDRSMQSMMRMLLRKAVASTLNAT